MRNKEIPHIKIKNYLLLTYLYIKNRACFTLSREQEPRSLYQKEHLSSFEMTKYLWVWEDGIRLKPQELRKQQALEKNSLNCHPGSWMVQWR